MLHNTCALPWVTKSTTPCHDILIYEWCNLLFYALFTKSNMIHKLMEDDKGNINAIKHHHI